MNSESDRDRLIDGGYFIGHFDLTTEVQYH